MSILDFNFADVTSLLGKIAKTADALLPIAPILGIKDKVVDIVEAGIEIGKNVMERVEDGRVVATSSDKEELRDLIVELEAKNAALDSYIRNS